MSAAEEKLIFPLLFILNLITAQQYLESVIYPGESTTAIIRPGAGWEDGKSTRHIGESSFPLYTPFRDMQM